MGLTTKEKIRIARCIGNVIAFQRRLFHADNRAPVKRSGFRWNLDLSEGIDLYIYIFGTFEPSTQKRIRTLVKPGDVVFDVGANIGAHTLLLSQLVGATGKVFAFEPTDYAFNKLRDNLNLNRNLANRVQVEQAFLCRSSDEKPPAQIYSSWPLNDQGGNHPLHQGIAKDTSNAQAFSIDDYIHKNSLGKVDLIKLDVDGYECDVLNGAANTLKNLRPKVIIEIAPYVLQEHGHSVDDLLSIFERYGYQLFDEKNFRPISAAQLKESRWGSGFNVVAVCEK